VQAKSLNLPSPTLDAFLRPLGSIFYAKRTYSGQSIMGDQRDKDVLSAFGGVYQLFPGEHQMDWNPVNVVVSHCEQ
jgi:hypothetical protein